MKNKGFTLIELLAVIVILAIIALIATPIIINIINDARESSYKRSIELYGKAIENAVANYQLKHPNEKIVGFYKTSGFDFFGHDDIKYKNRLYKFGPDWRSYETDVVIEYDGKPISCDNIIIYEDGSIYTELCSVGGHSVDYTYGTYKQFYKPMYYSWVSDSVKVGDPLPDDINSYTPGSNTYYLGFDSNDGENISAAYLCFKKDGKEYCLKPGNYLINIDLVSYIFGVGHLNESDSCKIYSYSSNSIEICSNIVSGVTSEYRCIASEQESRCYH